MQLFNQDFELIFNSSIKPTKAEVADVLAKVREAAELGELDEHIF